ncbi:SpoIIE family protein phosphatase [Geodermatophilus nigrescens]
MPAADAEPPDGPDASFGRFARMAARLLQTPVALVMFVSGAELVVAGVVDGPAPVPPPRRLPLSGSLCQQVVTSAAPLMVADVGAHAPVRDDPTWGGLPVGAYAGAPLTDAEGAVVGVLCAVDGRPRAWTAEDAEALDDVAAACSTAVQLQIARRRSADAITQAARSAAQAQQLRVEHERDRSRWLMALQAGQVGTFDLDLATGALTVDARLLELSAMTPASFGGRPEDVYAHVHPDDVGEVIARVQQAIDTGGSYDAEYRIVLPDGGRRWLAARGEVVGAGDAAPRLLGVVHDTTAQRDTLALAAQTLESMAVGYLAMDADWRITYVNDEAQRALGRPRAQLVGGIIWELFPGTVGTDFEAGYRRAADTGQPYTFDAYYPEPLNAWYEVRANPEHGGVALYFTDVTARVRLQQRSDLLAEVTRQLTGTLEAADAVAGLGRLLVPALADWAVVSLVDEDERSGGRRTVRDLGWWHADPALRPVVASYARHRIAALHDTSYLNRALLGGQAVTVPAGAADAIRAVSEPGVLHELLDRLAPESFAVLPLRGRGRTVGLLTLFHGAARAPLSGADLQTAEDIAGRAGLALDNARLFRQQRQLAEGLQRSLLTAPATSGPAEIVVRYTPAAEAAQVGGDWYDAFAQPQGATIVTIGDVLGHNTEAAAAMGQVRSMLRAIAVTTGAGPAEILTRVDAAMSALSASTTATAVVLRLEQSSEQAARGVATVRWSNAGHLPPLVLEPGGSLRSLAAPRADLLLGVDPAAPRREHETTLGAGSLLLLYTDGLIERRDADLDTGSARLRQTLRDLTGHGARGDQGEGDPEPDPDSGLDIDELCDQLLARMLPAAVDDDVALVAVRLTGQDRRRPAEPARDGSTADGSAPEAAPHR